MYRFLLIQPGVQRFRNPGAWNDRFGMPNDTLQAVILCNLMEMETVTGTVVKPSAARKELVPNPIAVKKCHVIWATFDGHQQASNHDGSVVIDNTTTESSCHTWIDEKWREIKRHENECEELQTWKRLFHDADFDGARAHFLNLQIIGDRQDFTEFDPPEGNSREWGIVVEGPSALDHVAILFAKRFLEHFRQLKPTAGPPIAGPSTTPAPPAVPATSNPEQAWPGYWATVLD